MRKGNIVLPTLSELMAMILKLELEHGWTSPTANIVQSGNLSVVHATIGDWSIDDRWYSGDCFAEDGRSRGQTIFSYREYELFLLQYAGIYTKNAIKKAVKPALRQAYEEGKFYGLRGLSKYESPEGYLYFNNAPMLTPTYNFTDMRSFQYHESVRGPLPPGGESREYLGHHNCQGMVLAELPFE